ncbi:MAG: hypothetical protein ABIO70_01175 [Pseudomonadota bacterium]
MRVSLLPLCLTACLAPGEAAPTDPSAPVPGLDLLRPGEAARMAAALGIADLGQLPAYTLDLSLSDVEGRYEGQGQLRFTNTTGRAQVRLPLLLHPNAPAAGGAPQSGTIAVHSLACVDRVGCAWAQENATVVVMTLDPPLLPGEQVTLDMEFGGRLRRLSAAANDVFAQSMGGMGQLGAPVGVADYGLLGAGDGLLTVASAYPMLAPFVDGAPVVEAPSAVGDLAWNQPAVFDLRVVTPTGLAVVTNLLDQPAEPLSAEAQLTRAQGAGVRDLVLVASRTWETRAANVGPTTVRAWFLPQDAAAGEQVLAAASAALETYTELLGPYPYRELDVAEASLVGGAGGVEFPAMVLIAGFLYRDPAASQSPLAGLMQLWGSLGMGSATAGLGDMLTGQRRFVVAHEVAHQWVPMLVGTDSQAAPIIDEPLAQYLAGRVSERVLGVEAGQAERDANVLLNYALYRLLGAPDGPAERPTAAFASSLEYGALVYGKAPYLYPALEERHGRATLDRALKRAVQAGAWRVVTPEAWLDALEEGGAGSAHTAARRWWREAHGDEDLGVDEDGEVAIRLMFGEEMAAQLNQGLAMTGMSFGDLLRMMMGGQPVTAPYQPGMPSPEDMLRLLEGAGR